MTIYHLAGILFCVALILWAGYQDSKPPVYAVASGDEPEPVPLKFDWTGHEFKCFEWGHHAAVPPLIADAAGIGTEARPNVHCPNPLCPSNMGRRSLTWGKGEDAVA